MPIAVIYVTYEEIFGRKLIEDDLIGLVPSLSLRDCLQTIGKLSHLLVSNDPEALERDERLSHWRLAVSTATGCWSTGWFATPGVRSRSTSN